MKRSIFIPAAAVGLVLIAGVACDDLVSALVESDERVLNPDRDE